MYYFLVAYGEKTKKSYKPMLNLRSVIKPEIQSTMKPKQGYTATLILDILQRLLLLQIFFVWCRKTLSNT